MSTQAFSFSGINDPIADLRGAPVGSYYHQLGTSNIWYKFGVLNTDWVPVTIGLCSPPERWCQNDIAASQTNVALTALVSVNFDTIKMIRSGSIVGLSTRFTEAITLGTATIKITKNGAAGTLGVVSTNASNTSGGQSTQAPGIDTYIAGDLIGAQITTNGTFAPVTTDVEAWIEYIE